MAIFLSFNPSGPHFDEPAERRVFMNMMHKCDLMLDSEFDRATYRSVIVYGLDPQCTALWANYRCNTAAEFMALAGRAIEGGVNPVHERALTEPRLFYSRTTQYLYYLHLELMYHYGMKYSLNSAQTSVNSAVHTSSKKKQTKKSTSLKRRSKHRHVNL